MTAKQLSALLGLGVPPAIPAESLAIMSVLLGPSHVGSFGRAREQAIISLSIVTERIDDADLLAELARQVERECCGVAKNISNAGIGEIAQRLGAQRGLSA